MAKKQNLFNMVTLEEAVYYQYGYGQSRDIIAQAAKYIVGFNEKKPFAGENDTTAFIGLITFLKINGYSVNLDAQSAASWIKTLGRSNEMAATKITEIASLQEHFHAISIEEATKSVLSQYGQVLVELKSAVK